MDYSVEMNHKLYLYVYKKKKRIELLFDKLWNGKIGVVWGWNRWVIISRKLKEELNGQKEETERKRIKNT